MNPYSAPTASMVLAKIDGSAPFAAMIPTISEAVDTLEMIDERVAASAKDRPTKSQILSEAAVSGMAAKVAAHKEMEAALRKSLAEMTEALGYEADVDDSLIVEAKQAATTVKRVASMIEEVFGQEGFVNALFNVLPKPEGASIRSEYKGFAYYNGK